MEIRIYKSNRVLELWSESSLMNVFPIGIGKAESGHKQFEGDMKTPEGEYKICVKNPKSKFYLSLGLNYPNPKDAEMAYQNKLISENEFSEIQLAHQNQKRPPWNTILGGQIYIHGDLENKSWTEGCIRMYKDDISLLFSVIEVGTSVFIHP